MYLFLLSLIFHIYNEETDAYLTKISSKWHLWSSYCNDWLMIVTQYHCCSTPTRSSCLYFFLHNIILEVIDWPRWVQYLFMQWTQWLLCSRNWIKIYWLFLPKSIFGPLRVFCRFRIVVLTASTWPMYSCVIHCKLPVPHYLSGSLQTPDHLRWFFVASQEVSACISSLGD